MHLHSELQSMNIDWLEPWWSTAEFDEPYHAGFKSQLEREVGPDHPLFGLQTRLVGRGNGDDALFAICDGTGRYAVVHLTWATHQESMPWPVTEIYPSLDAFVAQRMIPENSQWHA